LAILKIAIGAMYEADLISLLANFSAGDVSELLNAILALKNFLRLGIESIANSILLILLHFCLSASEYENHEVRYHTTHVLLLFCKSEYKDVVLNRFTEMVQSDHPVAAPVHNSIALLAVITSLRN
jgi:hypothetical protein